MPETYVVYPFEHATLALTPPLLLSSLPPSPFMACPRYALNRPPPFTPLPLKALYATCGTGYQTWTVATGTYNNYDLDCPVSPQRQYMEGEGQEGLGIEGAGGAGKSGILP